MSPNCFPEFWPGLLKYMFSTANVSPTCFLESRSGVLDCSTCSLEKMCLLNLIGSLLNLLGGLLNLLGSPFHLPGAFSTCWELSQPADSRSMMWLFDLCRSGFRLMMNFLHWIHLICSTWLVQICLPIDVVDLTLNCYRYVALKS